MGSRWTLRRTEHGRAVPEGGLVAFAAAMMPLLLIVALVPRPLVLPVFALTAFGAAGLAAFVAWMRHARWHAPGVTLWDVSGALVLLGCAAGIFSRPENALQLFGYVVAP